MRREYITSTPDGHLYRVLECPICGSGAIFIKEIRIDEKKLYKVYCFACGCFGKSSKYRIIAVKKWNKLKKVRRVHHIYGLER